jgi:hypothetical protein
MLLSLHWLELDGFCPCDKISGKNNLKAGRFILAHGFRGSNPWSAGSVGVGLKQGRNIMIEGKLLASQQPGSRSTG